MRIAFFIYCVLFSISVQAQKFTGSFDLVVSHAYKNGNERVDTISYYFGEQKTAVIIHAKGNQPDLRLVFSPADSTITGLFEVKEKKGGYILPMNDKYWPEMQIALRPYGTGPRTQLNYSGNTKEINGREASEILAESTNYEASIWMAEDIPLNMTSVLAYQSVGVGKDSEDIKEFDLFGVEGLPSEVLLKSKIGKGDVLLRVISISEEFDPKVFSTEGHTLSKMDQ